VSWISRTLFVLAALLATPGLAGAQFVETFDRSPLAVDQSQARNGWAFRTGDGEATVNFSAARGTGTVTVDARADKRGIWWAMVRRSVSPAIDDQELARPDRELRVEARVRTDAAPRRINLHFNHSRTTDFHSHLTEYDLPDNRWHTISFTTKGFDAQPSDEVFVQLAMVDWGRQLFKLDIDYIKVSVVDPVNAGPDLGEPLPYRPAIPDVASLQYHVPITNDVTVDAAYPQINLSAWSDWSTGVAVPALSVSGSQLIVLRPDLSAFGGRKPAGWGVLELTTQSVQWASTELEEFGYLRALEILGGASDWTRLSLTRDKLLNGYPETAVFGQMFIDVPPARERGSKTYILVSPPVLERLLSGRTRGIAVVAQGAVNASFASSAATDPTIRPKLHFSLR
jgi:hypothetical protein